MPEVLHHDGLHTAIVNCMRVSTSEDVQELCRFLGIDVNATGLKFAVSSVDERNQADLDQYADEIVRGTSGSMHDSTNLSPMVELAMVVPLRLEYSERKFLRLLESTIDSSEYTDRVDSVPAASTPAQQHRHTALVLKNVCSLLSGLVIAHDASSAECVLNNRDFSPHQEFFVRIFEIGRRYKILNPERMRESYVKMMYFLQDLSRPEIADLFDFKFDSPVHTVYSLLTRSSEDGLALLCDPFLETATSEILPRGKSKWKVQEEIKVKENAIKRLTAKYAVQSLRRHRTTRFTMSNFFSSKAGDEDSADDVQSSTFTREEIERCIYSICDLNTFLRFNQTPCERMIELLKNFFSTDTCLAIVEGCEGARLSHSHERQFTFVLQSLTLWAEVMKDMMKLWHAAEADLLDPSNPYLRTQTGQGMQRVQKAPRVYALMTAILQRVQRRLGSWVGSSTIHLGDENVPNALIFIDKYLQVPRILGPIVLCIDKIEAGFGSEIVSTMGGAEAVQKTILRDFFRHGFDGSGGDTFFEAGSCVDGRLTSAWNWCSRIESKEFYPVFQLTGFVGFDSAK